MLKPNTPITQSRIVGAADLRDAIKHEVLTVCDTGPRKAGRPRHTVLGEERMQMTVEICARIVGLVVTKITEDGGVLESNLDALYTVGGRRTYARDLIRAMSRTKRGVVSDVPAERLYLSLGDIIRVGPPKTQDGHRAPAAYVAKRGAAPFELTACWNSGRKRAAEAAARASIDSDLFAAVVPGMSPDESFEDHVTKALEEYHANQRQDGAKTRKR